MRLRVIRTVRGHNSTQIRSVDGSSPPEVVEGLLVFYRQPQSDGVPRWTHSANTLDSTIRLCRRLALLLDDGKLWFTSPALECTARNGGGWTVKTENSVYRVDVVAAVRHSNPPKPPAT